MSRIELVEITKSFGPTRVLSDVSLDIREGEFLSLLGPSGCGKSTLLRILAGLEAQDGGSVRIGGAPVDGLRASARDLAMVFQSYALYPHLTVGENIAVPLVMRRLSTLGRLPLVGRLLPRARRTRAEIARQVEAAARMLDIAHLLGRKPGQLSGGQKQRVAVGRAIVREPKAFLFDEPLSNLDAKLRVHMRAELAQLHRRLAATFVYVTHDQAEAMTMSDRIAVMMEGRILQVDRPEQVYERPADIRVAEFIGAPTINLLPGEIRGDGGVAMLGRGAGLSALGEAGPCRVGLRPERLSLAPAERAPLVGALVHVENLGPEGFAHVAVAGAERPVVARVEAGGREGLALGQPVGLAFAPEAAHVFGRDGRRLATTVAWSSAEVAHG